MRYGRTAKKDMPSIDQLKAELKKGKIQKRYGRVLRSTIYTLVVVAAIAVLVAMIWMPVLQIYGTSMSPTLSEGEIVVCMKGAELKTGDIVGFYVGNRLLIKRHIAGAGQWVDIDSEGNVYVDGVLLDEPYITEKALGDSNIEYLYQVAEGRIFVLGDHRATSADSRNTAVGCIAEEFDRIVWSVAVQDSKNSNIIGNTLTDTIVSGSPHYYSEADMVSKDCSVE